MLIPETLVAKPPKLPKNRDKMGRASIESGLGYCKICATAGAGRKKFPSRREQERILGGTVWHHFCTFFLRVSLAGPVLSALQLAAPEMGQYRLFPVLTDSRQEPEK